MSDLAPVPDAWWGRPCTAYHVQPELDPAALEALGAVQRRAAALWPHPLHTAPPQALHVTVYPFAMVADAYDKDAYWRQVEPLARGLLADLCRDAPPLRLEFFRLMVTNVAIIAVARDETGLIEAIRRRIVETVPPPPVRGPIHYNLIHSTLARYRSAEPVPASAVAAIEALPVAVTAPVSRINVVRETRFPCLARDVLLAEPIGRRGA
ncbi:MAG TPA: 2'-5' RNA ligase family protein [Microvirga sp.]|jgi:hypothetical protein|nr:2'-5' RNA ligase family protein [Microvirga sp.]